ncbi:MAG: hypothetical protein C4529_07020 [Deltaproteobacteria bacterium]|nr:MAG: hypothetical protein C4529_07020 [Deltaproteobacteria bacterium]
MADPFPAQTPSLTGPIENGFAVTPHDSNEVAQTTRAIWVGGAGTLVVITRGGDTLTLVGVPAGTLLPIRAKIVKSTGTTATSIVGLY